MTYDNEEWEDLDCTRRMWGIFDAIGYSCDPIAIFRTEADANEWLAFDVARGDDRTICCETCVLAIDGLTGQAWNSTESAPVRA